MYWHDKPGKFDVKGLTIERFGETEKKLQIMFFTFQHFLYKYH